MKISYGKGSTKYGPGVSIELTGDEVALAIDTYLTAHNIYVSGARTIRVGGELCKPSSVYIDPSGFVINHNDGVKWSGRGPKALRRVRTHGGRRSAVQTRGALMSDAKYHVWTNGEDWFVARTAEEAVALAADHYGPCDEVPDDYEIVAPETPLKIWEGSPGENEQTKTAAEWISMSAPGLLASRNY